VDDTAFKKLDIPIIADDVSVRLFLANKKTQMRKMLTVQPESVVDGVFTFPEEAPKRWHECTNMLDMCHFGTVGDILRVQEAFRTEQKYDDCLRFRHPENVPMAYEIDGIPEGRGFGKLRKPQFMGRWASRIFLQITEVRVERMQDISDEDAIAEGATRKSKCIGHAVSGVGCRTDGWSMDWPDVEPDEGWGHVALASPRFAYASYVIGAGHNGNFGLSRKRSLWDHNPWVFVVSFKRITKEQAYHQ
jgi:hypothetical protein